MIIWNNLKEKEPNWHGGKDPTETELLLIKRIFFNYEDNGVKKAQVFMGFLCCPFLKKPNKFQEKFFAVMDPEDSKWHDVDESYCEELYWSELE